MSLWEYKVITSGKGGFATPALLEKFLNDLGRDEWEIIHFQTPPDNFLAFTGLVRRSTQRDWTLQDAAAAAAKAEAEKLRAEFEAKFKAAATPAPVAGTEERTPSFLEEKSAPDDGFRKPVDTSRDDDPEAQEDEKPDEWDKLTAAEEDELPTFFEAIKPHMRRNQRGPGMSVGVDYLAKKWDQSEDDLRGALVECGFVVPADEDSKVEYVEYDGDLFWLNINRRGELWINTKEKPRPVFRPVKAQRAVIEDEPAKQAQAARQAPAPADGSEPKTVTDESAPARTEGGEVATEGQAATPNERPAKSGGQGAPLPTGPALLAKIRPHMRRNRRGPGGSGSTTFLARAMRTNEADLKAAFVTLGLTMPATPGDKAVYTEFGEELWWLNLDSRGGLWINGRDKKPGETAAAAGASDTAAAAEAAAGGAPQATDQSAPLETVAGAAAPDAVPAPEVAPSADAPVANSEFSAPVPAAATGDLSTAGAEFPGSVSAPEASTASSDVGARPGSEVLAGVRLLLKETKTGAIAAKLDRLAEELGKPADELTAILVGAGLKVPEKAREKPVFVEHAGEIFWFNRNARGELWVNAKASKFADKDEEAGDDADDDAPKSDDAAKTDEADGDNKPARRNSRPRTKKPE
jgi:hypothetical protein